MYIGIDPVYLMLVVPVLILGFVAQRAVTNRFEQYSKERSRHGYTGARAAREILDRNDLQGVAIERVSGKLSDHYDPRGPVLRLSGDVADQPSIAAIAVGIHEAGHAVQDKAGYWAFGLRSMAVPVVQFGSSLGPLLIGVGLLLNWIFYSSGDAGLTMAWLGVILYAVTVIFSVITLPVELDASRRAKQLVVEYGIVDKEEVVGVNKVLNAAAWTYVVAALAAFIQLIYWISVIVRRQS